MKTFYKKQLAAIYGLDPRTFKKRTMLYGLHELIPELQEHKGIVDAEGMNLIVKTMGPPDSCPSYIRLPEGTTSLLPWSQSLKLTA